MSVLPGKKAPLFAGVCWEGKWTDVSLTDYIREENSISFRKGSWLVLFFYPMDFGYIAPSELLELERKRSELEKMNCKILAVSTDAAVVHEKFSSLSPEDGGVKGIKFPLLEDVDGLIASKYGVMKKDTGYTYRAYFIIDNEGVVRARVVGDLPVGLGIEEIPKKVAALQKVVKADAWYHIK